MSENSNPLRHCKKKYEISAFLLTNIFSTQRSPCQIPSQPSPAHTAPRTQLHTAHLHTKSTRAHSKPPCTTPMSTNPKSKYQISPGKVQIRLILFMLLKCTPGGSKKELLAAILKINNLHCEQKTVYLFSSH